MNLRMLKDAQHRIWQEMPDEVRRLSEKRGMLRPLGPISYAEADARIYSEIVSNLVLGERALSLPSGTAKSPVVRYLLRRLETRFHGWYELPEAAVFVRNALAAVEQATDEESLAVLEEITLYLTRLDLWLDLIIPWNELNTEMIRKLEASTM